MENMSRQKTEKVWRAVRRALPWLVFAAVLCALALAHGMEKAFVNDYNIMNGDWQNYNPVRRLLAGQTPYKDFAVYLGAGELYSMAAVLLCIGNSFGRSMLASNALTWLFFELLVVAAAAAVLQRGRAVRGISYLVCGFCFAAIHGVGSLQGGFWPAGLLLLAGSNGNSARMIRSGGLSLAVLIICAGVWWHRRKMGQRGKGLDKIPPDKIPDENSGKTDALHTMIRAVAGLFPLKPAYLVPFAAGFFVPWSNDMGAALYLSLSLAWGLWLLRAKPNLITLAKQVGQYVLISIAGLGVAVLAISRFHPFAWLQFTRGAGADQSWYYGSLPEEKLLSLADIPVNAAFFVTLVLAMACGVWLLRAKKDEDAATAAGGFTLALAMVLWHLLYSVLSASKNGPLAGCDAVLVALVPPLALHWLGAAWRHFAAQKATRCRAAVEKYATGALALACACVLCVALAGQVQARAAGRGAEYTYQPSLGAWLGDQAPKLETEQSVAAGKTVWSTYAGALESMTGQYQPSGTDYIIHVLGDSQRLAYLTKFQQGGFDLVAIPSWKVNEYERWSRNANWWFYRQLYRNWKPVASSFACGGMHLFWEPCADANMDADVTLTAEPQPDGSLLLTATAPTTDFCGVADVAINYTANCRFLRAEALTEKALCEKIDRPGWTCDFYLPTEKPAWQLPITMENGTGQVLLHPMGGGQTVEATLELQGVYPDWEYYFD